MSDKCAKKRVSKLPPSQQAKEQESTTIRQRKKLKSSNSQSINRVNRIKGMISLKFLLKKAHTIKRRPSMNHLVHKLRTNDQTSVVSSANGWSYDHVIMIYRRVQSGPRYIIGLHSGMWHPCKSKHKPTREVKPISIYFVIDDRRRYIDQMMGNVQRSTARAYGIQTSQPMGKKGDL